MIAVIADDLTGAAELAGIGLTYHLKTEINTIVDPECDADLLIIATDTRSMPVDEAKKVITQITQQLLKLTPRLIFKKIDSVLRGHVLDEIESQMAASNLNRTLIVPGNPSHGKTIIDSVYYYQGQPVHLSNYANDPAFPVKSSDVKTMLRANGHLQILKSHQPIPAQGITLGEVAIEADYDRWVEKIEDNTLVAGSSGLFSSLVNYLRPVPSGANPKNESFKTPRLFVFGSTFNKDSHQIADGLLHQIPVMYLSADVIFEGDGASVLADDYIKAVADTLQQNGSCIMAVHPDATTKQSIAPCALTNKMGLLVNRIHQKTPLQQLLIEGGATATAILQQLHIFKLYPIKQIAPGVISTSIPGNNQLTITLKPGSYQWPAEVW
ncbi:MAG: four-carbon acid sugar kinase family protein [Bacteroidota bacterium]